MRGAVLQYLDKKFRADAEIILKTNLTYSDAFKHADDSLQLDRDFVFQIIKTNGSTIRLLDSKFRSDPEIILEASKTYNDAISFIDPVLATNPQFILSMIKINGRVIPYIKTYTPIRSPIHPISIKNYLRYYSIYRSNINE